MMGGGGGVEVITMGEGGCKESIGKREGDVGLEASVFTVTYFLQIVSINGIHNRFQNENLILDLSSR